MRDIRTHRERQKEWREAKRAQRKRRWELFASGRPDFLTPYAPSQLQEPRRTPVQKLLLSLLVDAVQCARGMCGPTVLGPRSREQIAREAQQWIADNSCHPFSFLFICEHLGLEPERVRRSISGVTR